MKQLKRYLPKIFMFIGFILAAGCNTVSPRPASKNLSSPNYMDYTVIGNKEYVDLPDFGLNKLEMKVDTGAQTSAMHAMDIREFEQNGEKFVSFKINPYRNSLEVLQLEAKIFDKRKVKGTCGKVRIRPVILSTIKLGDRVRTVEFTLSDRSRMQYRFLLGREAIKDTFFVHPGAEFLLE